MTRQLPLRFKLALLGLLATLLPAVSTAAETSNRIFQIEVIPFINQQYIDNHSQAEVDGLLQEVGSASAESLVDWPEKTHEIGSVDSNPENYVAQSESPQLSSEYARLSRSGRYQPLTLQAWYDRIPADRWGKSVLIRSGTISSGAPEITGYVRLQRGFHLHLLIDMEYRSRESGKAFHIRERRRVNLNEAHYFDNPAFGIIARVTPVK